MYHDMHTGKWWWQTQKELEREKPGATIIPIILSSDKTQITMFRNKSAYPIYMTIGNIPKDIRRKPSHHAHILLAYLPTTRLDHISNQAARRRTIVNLFHACMSHILKPIHVPGRQGMAISSGDGVVRRGHPILACYVGDYPEQVLVSGTKTGDCHKCDIDHNTLGSKDSPFHLRDLGEILEALALADIDPVGFAKRCSELKMKAVQHPFWEGLPFTNIFHALTPDVLHQLYQGLVKHMIAWIKDAFGTAEIDARCRRLPPNHNMRVFSKGISSLARVSGTEHNQICRFLLGIIIDIRLPNNASSARLVRALRGLLDFLYLTQYPCHTDETLTLLDDALQRFHDNKSIFIDLGIRTQFNLPKLHAYRHYLHMIQQFGTTDNYNTEYTERLHIDLTKDAYRATNHKDEYSQMTLWLERREKMIWHSNYIRWRTSGTDPPQQSPLSMEYLREFKMTKHPSAKAVPLDHIIHDYGATHFRAALARYVVMLSQPDARTRQQVERAAAHIYLPFTSVSVFYKIKFNVVCTDGSKDNATVDSVHVRPECKDQRGKNIPGRFDTVLVNTGDGGDRGVAGESKLIFCSIFSMQYPIGYRVAQVRVVFTIPEQSHDQLVPPRVNIIPQHLAYVEWFTPFATPELHHGMYKISRCFEHGERLASIIPVKNIRRSVHLIPKFGRLVSREWTSSTVLEECNDFFVNPFTDRHAYLTIF
ncbi:hypothetical protein PAXRUDRAFT_325404 [Paxillus rubicundulus Ve08.2h10]|uniref:DUF6830 domain-containing protein n=1 Tax=Paxillus rubicundulus Ve08.2h10 TaxID=930991 RepID=A0A0D0C5S1_9AGAM|nr:hypothetical protein PAXRUDRAFT_325404 [Paxillus rubicundulus Ve08.2h10]